jgi:hypothetical protein
LECEFETVYLSSLAYLTPSQYPVIEAHRATRESHLYSNPRIITGGTNRHLLQPTKVNKQRRKSKVKAIQDSADKGKHRSDSSSGEPSSSKSRTPLVGKLLRQETSSSSSSGKSDKSQLVDLVVEDHDAEDIERVRARKEGGSGWNEVAPKHYV